MLHKYKINKTKRIFNMNIAKQLGYTLLNLATSATVGAATGAAVTKIINRVQSKNHDVKISAFACGIVGILASTLPPASANPVARTISAAVVGGLTAYLGTNPF
jgi:hypothetical protein